MKASKGIRNIGGGAAGLVLVVAIVVAVNIILGNLGFRADLTEERLYTLSEGTREVLKNLPEPVTLKFFFNASNAEVPVPLKGFAQRVEDLLVEYQVSGGGKVVVEKFDPKPDSDAEDWAQRYGVVGQQIGYMGPTLYLGLVAVMGEHESVQPVLDPQNENLLEYQVTRMLTRVANPKKPVLGVLSGLPVLGTERSPYPMPDQPPPRPRWFAFEDLGQDYEIRSLDPSAAEIDPDIDALILVHPKELSDATLYAIDQFVLRGGRLAAFLDPLCLAEAETQATPPMGMGMGRNSSDLGQLLTGWGVTFDAGKVVADLEASSRLRTGDGSRIEDNPVWLSLYGERLNRKNILTSAIEFAMLPYAGAFTVRENSDLEVTPLISSSESSCLVDAMSAQFSGEAVRRGFKSGMTPLSLAVRLYGKLPTAFPNGKPGSEPKDPAEEGSAPPASEPGLKESAGKSTVVLVGDVDMLYDRFCVQEMNFLGFKAHQPMNDNLIFFNNLVEQLAGSTALIRIRTRGKTERPFDVVLGLQRQAQERYLEEETQLQQKLEAAQSRLNELQSSKDSKQRFILTSSQRREIENFEQQVLKTKGELKLVRRRLREDIERLGVKVKAVNILLVPILVAFFGIGFGLHRRMRTQG